MQRYSPNAFFYMIFVSMRKGLRLCLSSLGIVMPRSEWQKPGFPTNKQRLLVGKYAQIILHLLLVLFAGRIFLSSFPHHFLRSFG